MDMEPLLADIKATTRQENFLLWFQRLAIGRQNQDVIIWIQRCCDDGTLYHRGHEDGFTRNLPGQDLKGHHETAVSSDGRRTTRLKVLDGIRKATLHQLGELARLAHFKGEPRHATIVDVVAKAPWMIRIPGRRRILVI